MIHSGKIRKHLHAITIAAVCWNIWRGRRNSIIFTDLSTPPYICVSCTYTDILFWIGLFFDKERLHLSEDNSHDDIVMP